jgi:excisionase family DNA binding protein
MTPLIDATAAATLLGISERSLRRLVAQGSIAHRKIGRRTLFSADDLAEFSASCRVPVRGASEPVIRSTPLKWIKRAS